MSSSSEWEYMTVLVAPEFLDYEEIHPKSVNGHELKNWKKIDMNTFLNQLGGEHWEMTGSLVSTGESNGRASYLFFKRVKS